MRIARALAAVAPSAAMAVSSAAKTMRARGEDVIDLGLGEPDFDTPPHIVEAAHRAAKAGQTRYTPTAGTWQLRQAVSDKFERENGTQFALDEVMVSTGAKQVIFNAMMATLEQGDEVILIAPYFGSYPTIIRALGGTPVVVETTVEAGFLPTPGAIEAAITPRTRWLILNSPSNPSGAVFSPQAYRDIASVLARHPGVAIMADEIYEHVTFSADGFSSFVQTCPELRDRTLTVNGVSKAYAMTGWRIGYGAGPRDLIAAMTTVQSQITSGASAISQAAAHAALTGPQACVAQFCSAYQRRRDQVVGDIEPIPGLTLGRPDGAFYAYISCAPWIGQRTREGDLLTDDASVAGYLLTGAKVAVVPGAAYGLSPCFRISTATADELLHDAALRIAAAADRLC